MTRVFDQAMFATRLSAFYQPFIGFLPQLGLAAILIVGGRSVINGDLTAGDFAAFYTYLLMLIAPMRSLGISLSFAQRATASGRRLFELLDREPRLQSAPDAQPLPPGNGRVRAARRLVRVRGRAADPARHRPRRSTAARRSRWSAAPARASRRS